MGFLKILFSNKITNTILNKVTSKGFSAPSLIIIFIGTYLGFNPDVVQQLGFLIGAMTKSEQEYLFKLIIYLCQNLLYFWIIILLIKNIFMIPTKEETLFIVIIRRIFKLYN